MTAVEWESPCDGCGKGGGAPVVAATTPSPAKTCAGVRVANGGDLLEWRPLVTVEPPWAIKRGQSVAGVARARDGQNTLHLWVRLRPQSRGGAAPVG